MRKTGQVEHLEVQPANMSNQVTNANTNNASHAPVTRTKTVGNSIKTYLGLDVFRSSVAIHRENHQNCLKEVQERDAWDEEDKEAMQEHQSLSEVPLCVPVKEMVLMMGQGIMWYYTFVRYIWVINTLTLVVSLINFVPHVIEVYSRDDADRPSTIDMLYISSYSDSLYGVWVFSVALSILLMFLVGPIYRSYVEKQQNKRFNGTGDFIEDPFEGQYKIETDECIDKIEYKVLPTRRKQVLGRIFSVSLFLCVLLFQSVVNYFLQDALREEESSISAFVLSVTIVFINFSLKYLSKFITTFEYHLYWSDYKKWDILKLYSFKILNIVVLFFVQRLEIERDSDECGLKRLAQQFFFLVVVDITIMNFVEIAGALAYNRLLKSYAEKSEESNESYKIEFDLSEEYVEIIYRQFIVGLGVIVFPLLPIVALFGNVIEYWLDRYKMLRISQKPRRTRNTYKILITLFFFVNGIGIMLAYPQGAIWILGGVLDMKDKCSVFP